MTPSTDWKELVPEGETARFELASTQLRDWQRSLTRNGSVMRALHSKGQPGVEAEFTVLPDLPEYARVGLFAKPATFRAYVRFSNGTAGRQPDRKPDVRGIAIKLLGVEGRKVIPGLEDAKTQDFSMIQMRTQPGGTGEDSLWMILGGRQPALFVPRMIGRFGPLRTFRILRTFLGATSAPLTSVATTRYFSSVPVKFGPYAVQYAVSPTAVAEPGAKAGASKNYLSEELAKRLAAGPISYDFRVQFFRDEQTTPIEDAAKEWTDEAAPFVTLARLTLPRQDLDSPRGKRLSEFIETLSFDPWHATEDFRPLGSIMRARSVAYRLSTQERKAAAEPDGSETFE